jgi:hypothetical protein
VFTLDVAAPVADTRLGFVTSMISGLILLGHGGHRFLFSLILSGMSLPVQSIMPACVKPPPDGSGGGNGGLA